MMSRSKRVPPDQTTATNDKAKILIVDDRQENILVLMGLLKHVNADFLAAGCGEEALELLLEFDFALAIIDVQMPGLNGIELAKIMRGVERTKKIPIIFVTAGPRNGETSIDGYQAGAVDFLYKPIVPEILTSKVLVFLQIYEQQQELIRQRDAIQELAQAKSQLLEDQQEIQKKLSASQRQLTAIINTTSALVYLIDKENRFLHVNLPFEKIFGQTLGNIIGKSIFDVFSPESAALHEANNLKVMTELHTIEFEEPLYQSNEVHYYSSVKSPLLDDEGKPIGIVSISTDITARKQIEHALRQADRRKDEFIAMLGHELRNPLTPINTIATLLHTKSLAPNDYKWACDALLRNVQIITRLVSDLMDVSRITRGLITLHLERIELIKLVEDALQAVNELISAKQQTLKFIHQNQPIVIYGDQVRLMQIFTNLIHNATKYTPFGGHIEIEIDASQKNAIFCIKDNGRGISSDFLPYIFELFAQDSESILDHSQGGLGIGLTLVKKLVELHEGHISAHSEGLNQGSTFIVNLPLHHDVKSHSEDEKLNYSFN